MGHFAFDDGYFANAGASNAPLWTLTNGIDGVNGVYNGGASGFPSSSYNASNYWIDIVFNTIATPAPPSITRATIWPDTITPSIESDSNPQTYELGVKFRSNRAGYIKGIRFYKGSANTGTHIGNLWSNTGTLLSSATFTNETASGWQEVLFDTAVPISANTTYVASYHTDVGHFAFDNSYFTTSGPATSPLRALMNGEEGANGVYKDGSSGFPTSTYNASNYWVDVVFSTNP